MWAVFPLESSSPLTKLPTPMSDNNLNSERRLRESRRQKDCGPPAGQHERRINIERRMFNLGLDGGETWLNTPPAGALNTPQPADEISSAGEASAPGESSLH